MSFKSIIGNDDDDVNSYNINECRKLILDLRTKNLILEKELKSLRDNNDNKNNSTTTNEDPFDLLSFPIDVINNTLTYVTIQDLSKLDIAYTNHSNCKRTKILKILSNSKSIIFDDIDLGDSFKYIDNFLAWVGSRGINILNLSIEIQYGSKYDDTYNIK